MATQVTERERTGQSTSLYLATDLLESLERLAVQRRKSTGKNISISALVNEAIKLYLKTGREVATQVTERERTGQSTSLYLATDLLESLERLAVQRRKSTGKNISISMQVDEAIEQLLKSEGVLN